MTQISTKTIRTEFSALSTYEKNHFANEFGGKPISILSVIDTLEQKLGDRIFKTSSEINKTGSDTFANRANAVILSLDEFTNDILAQNIDTAQAIIGAELLSKNLARQLNIPKDQAALELKKMRSKVQKRLYEKEKNIARVANQFTGSSTDVGLELDPLKRKREYMFYDAFAVIRGPRRIEIIDFNNDIMSVNVNLSTEITPGTFSITLANPLEQYVDDAGCYAFYTGDTIRIFATRRIHDKDKDRYTHIFWGIIEQVSDDFGDGAARITLQGQDITAWFQYTTVVTAPTVLQTLSGSSLNANGHKYAGMRIVEILADIIFNDIGGFNSLEAYSLTKLEENSKDDAASKATTNKEDIIAFWRDLFLNELVVKLFGFNKKVTSKNAATLSSTPEEGLSASTGNLSAVSSSVQDILGDKEDILQLPWSNDSKCDAQKMLDHYIPIRVYADAAITNTFQIEDTPKIEVIKRVLEGTMFEFFMDSDGSIVCKPPFYNEYPANNDTTRYKTLAASGGCGGTQSFLSRDQAASSGPADEYTIKDLDIIGFTLKEDSSALVTRQPVTLEPPDLPNTVLNEGGAQNNDLIKRYGIRVGSPKKIRTLGSAEDAPTIAKALMDYANTKYYTASIQIIGRPELRCGRTIYFEPRNVIFYITALSHQFTAGGTFATTITAVAGRRMFLDSNAQPLTNVFDGEQFDNRDIPSLEKDIRDGASQISTLTKAKADADAAANALAPGTPARAAADKQATQANADLVDAQARQTTNQNQLKKKNAFENIRTRGFFTEADKNAIGQPPRRITDSFGRRLYGTLPYGIMATPPKNEPPTESNTTSPAQKAGANSTSAQGGAGTQQSVPASAGTAGANGSKNSVIDPGKSTAEQAAANNTQGGSGTPDPGNKQTIELAKNCSTQAQDSKSFNASSIVRRRIVNGANL